MEEERAKIVYSDNGMEISHIRGSACDSYMNKLKEIESIGKVKDLSDLPEDAFYNWKVMRKYETK